MTNHESFPIMHRSAPKHRQERHSECCRVGLLRPHQGSHSEEKVCAELGAGVDRGDDYDEDVVKVEVWWRFGNVMVIEMLSNILFFRNLKP